MPHTTNCGLTAPPQPARAPLSLRLRRRALAAWAAAACLISPLAMAQGDEAAALKRLIQAGQLSEAMNQADQYLAGNPRHPQMRFLRGVIQTELGQTSAAIATFLKLTEDFPELPEPYNNLAVLYASQGQFDHARAALEMAVRTNPSYAIAHENLGDVYAQLAIQSYGRTLQLDPGRVSAGRKLNLLRTLFASDAARPVGAVTSSPALPPAATRAP